MSLLYLACAEKWEFIVERIYTHSYEVFEQDRNGWNVFHHACYRHPPSNVVRLLLDMLEPFYTSPLIQSKGRDREYESDEKHYEHHHFAMKQNNSGCTALHYACQYSSPEVVYEIVRLHPYAVSVTDSEGLTPLHYVYKSSNTLNQSNDAFLKSFMLISVDQTLARKNENILSPIILLCTKYNKEIRELLNGSDLSPTTEASLKEFWRVLIFLALATDPNCLIVKHMAERLRDSANFSTFPLLQFLLNLPIFSAPDSILMDVLLAILKTYPDEAQVTDEKGNYPLYTVLSNHNYYPHEKMHLLIQALLYAYPQAAEHKDSNGKLPFHLATENGLKMNHGLKYIISFYPQALNDSVYDEERNMQPKAENSHENYYPSLTQRREPPTRYPTKSSKKPRPT